ncbi:uncharacterized protein NFIA_008460 [Aspergillus fischeri NRRL 181]|uniref:Uncharacterized protein n=1 Tax=Neosartorya fischeri (strain ATCC 1020 / DSM 3700 / CBS 544.65 / FGSC A1164 / JCM 1740 / NRRL 181 / WB 181) TaxID=331117 RepID=A1D176_NEOFI|nr:uncharacterized protein NFIA_008460 [Aspergillus fischeri NRRL 181]EAW22169.1 hypothetical protein NFIA_008460 [Aspergillus fischeri NRRL 181]
MSDSRRIPRAPLSAQDRLWDLLDSGIRMWGKSGKQVQTLVDARNMSAAKSTAAVLVALLPCALAQANTSYVDHNVEANPDLTPQTVAKIDLSFSDCENGPLSKTLTMEQGGKHQLLSPPKLSNGNSQHLQPELSKSPGSSKFPSPLSPPPRWPARQFARCVSRSPVTPEACRAILSSFEFEKSYDEQSEMAILKLEKWLGYERWPWLDDFDRRRTICDKVSLILDKFLWSHRFVFYSYPIVAQVLY